MVAEGGRGQRAPILGGCIGEGYLDVGMDWGIRFLEETDWRCILLSCVLKVLGFLRDALGIGRSVNFLTLIYFLIKNNKKSLQQ